MGGFGGWGGGGRFVEARRLLTFSAFRMGVNGGWALVRINTVTGFAWRDRLLLILFDICDN